MEGLIPSERWRRSALMTHDELMARYRVIVDAHVSGQTYAQIAEAHGMSRERVRQLLEKGPPKARVRVDRRATDRQLLATRLHRWLQRKQTPATAAKVAELERELRVLDR